jgi:hypothetical protein
MILVRTDHPCLRVEHHSERVQQLADNKIGEI